MENGCKCFVAIKLCILLFWKAELWGLWSFPSQILQKKSLTANMADIVLMYESASADTGMYTGLLCCTCIKTPFYASSILFNATKKPTKKYVLSHIFHDSRSSQTSPPRSPLACSAAKPRKITPLKNLTPSCHTYPMAPRCHRVKSNCHQQWTSPINLQ